MGTIGVVIGGRGIPRVGGGGGGDAKLVDGVDNNGNNSQVEKVRYNAGDFLPQPVANMGPVMVAIIIILMLLLVVVALVTRVLSCNAFFCKVYCILQPT